MMKHIPFRGLKGVHSYVSVFSWVSLASLLLASCSADSIDTERRDAEALTFIARLGVHADTRATSSGTWEGNELIAVRSISGGSTEEATLQYKANAEGELTGIDESNTFYWRTPNDAAKAVTAWYEPQAAGGYSAVYPDGQTFSVPADQRAGLQQGDFLMAPTKTFPFVGDRMLPFYHQMAKVRIRISSGTPIGKIESATIGTLSSPLATQATFTAPTGAGKRYGSWSELKDMAAITPMAITPDVDGFKTQLEALIVPQTVAGKTLMRVVIDGKAYTYTEDSGVEKFLPGCVYTYNLKVGNSGLLINTTLQDWVPDELDNIDRMNIIVTTRWDAFTGDYGTLTNPEAWMQFTGDYGTVSTTTKWIETLTKYGSLSEVIGWDEETYHGTNTSTDDQQWTELGTSSGTTVAVSPWTESTDQP